MVANPPSSTLENSGPSQMTSPLHCLHHGPASITALQGYPSSLLTSMLPLCLPSQSAFPQQPVVLWIVPNIPPSAPLLTASVSARGIRISQILTVLPQDPLCSHSAPLPFPIRPDVILPQGLCTVLPLPGTLTQKSLGTSFKCQLLTRTWLKLHCLLYFSPNAQ